MSRPPAPPLPASLAMGARCDLLAQAFADCETLIAQGLLALARAEDAKADAAYAAWLAAAQRSTRPEIAEQVRLGPLRHHARAACLREAALAVSVGQFRTDEYDLDPDALAKAHFRAANAAGAGKARRGGVARAASLSPARRESIARGAAIARWWEPQCGHTAGQARVSPAGGMVYCGICNEPYKRKNTKGE